MHIELDRLHLFRFRFRCCVSIHVDKRFYFTSATIVIAFELITSFVVSIPAKECEYNIGQEVLRYSSHHVKLFKKCKHRQ